MRIVVTGKKGQVARSLMERAGQFPEISIITVGRPQLDLENVATIAPVITDMRPDLIVNAAAYTAVDRAEQEPQRAFAINREGAAAIAAVAQVLGVPLVHLSTDYVFSGSKRTAYSESDDTGPLGVYGRSKLEGEVAVRSLNPGALILRTSWIYSPFGVNFVKTILRLASERSELRVIDDQVGNPTSAFDLADAVLRIALDTLGRSGTGTTLHVAGTGSVSWYGLARHVFAVSRLCGGPSADVVPISSSEYPTLALRPPNSCLDTSAFRTRFSFALPNWQESVEETVRKLMAGVI